MKISKLIIAMSLVTFMTANVFAQRTMNTQTKINLKQKSMVITSIKNQYSLQSRLFVNVLEGISDAEAKQQINENINNVEWIVGHTLDIQYNLAMMMGLKKINPYSERFGFGKPFDPSVEYPSVKSMLKDWNELTPKIKAALDALGDEELKRTLPFSIPFPEQNFRGFLAFQMHHLGYEIGQLGLYRKFLGKKVMSYR